jgi:hypothetical protein
MSNPKLKLPPIPESEQTPRVQELVRLLMEQQKRIAELEEEIKRLKGHPRKPKIQASRMDQENAEKPKGVRGPQRAKTAELVKHEDRVIAPEGLPADARERGYRVQGLCGLRGAGPGAGGAHGALPSGAVARAGRAGVEGSVAR